MRDLVIIPTYTRPEMLWLCLEHLARCEERPEICVCIDQHQGVTTPVAEIREVVEKFPQLRIVRMLRDKHVYHGNSFNVLTAYRDALKSDAEFVYLVEDDVMVTPDFFNWHQRVQSSGKFFCSIAAANPRHTDESAVGYFIGSDYGSLGVCFKRQNLERIVSYLSHAYLADSCQFLQREFPKSKLGYMFAEQDGLIGRIMERDGLTSAWANPPRCQHVGWYGYNRPNGHAPRGTLEQRFNEVKRILAQPERLRRCSRDFQDIEPLVMA